MKKEISFRIDYAENGIIATELIEGSDNPNPFGKREVYLYTQCTPVMMALESFASKLIPRDELLVDDNGNANLKHVKIIISDEPII